MNRSVEYKMMSNRIKDIGGENDRNRLIQIKKSHAALSEVLEKINAQARQYSIIKTLLRELEDKLLNHFVLQNEPFYNELAQMYADQNEKVKMCEFLKIDLRGLKLQAIEFFEQYPVDGAHAHFLDFPRNFSLFYHGILLRFKLEEERLFPLLNT